MSGAIAVVGPGHAGLPLAAGFGRQRKVMDRDIRPARIAEPRRATNTFAAMPGNRPRRAAWPSPPDRGAGGGDLQRHRAGTALLHESP